MQLLESGAYVLLYRRWPLPEAWAPGALCTTWWTQLGRRLSLVCRDPAFFSPSLLSAWEEVRWSWQPRSGGRASAVSCLVRDAARRLCAPSPRHLWLDVGQSGSFIIGSVEAVLFAARQCIVVLVLSGSLPDVVSWCVCVEL
jgi:hypothetical protein